MKPIHVLLLVCGVFLFVCGYLLGGMTCCDSGRGDKAKTEKQPAEKAVAEKASSTSEAVEEPPADKPAAEKASNTSEAEGESQPRELTNSIGMKFVLIPPGEFMMGSPVGEEGRKDDEGPRHRVRITKGFYMGVTEVTRGQFRRFVEATGYKTDAEKDVGGWGLPVYEVQKEHTWRNPAQTDLQPVVFVSWYDASSYCKWLSGKEKKRYVLPTEAEWEYACRAGSSGRFWWGESETEAGGYANVADRNVKSKLSDMACFDTDDGCLFTSAVGSYEPNDFGLYDMLGNVWEWCEDRYGEEYYGQSPVDDPKGPDHGWWHVLRGGSRISGPTDCRSAVRNCDSQATREYNFGFRLRLDAE